MQAAEHKITPKIKGLFWAAGFAVLAGLVLNQTLFKQEHNEAKVGLVDPALISAASASSIPSEIKPVVLKGEVKEIPDNIVSFISAHSTGTSEAKAFILVYRNFLLISTVGTGYVSLADIPGYAKEIQKNFYCSSKSSAVASSAYSSFEQEYLKTADPDIYSKGLLALKPHLKGTDKGQEPDMANTVCS